MTELFPTGMETNFWNIIDGSTGLRSWNKDFPKVFLNQEKDYYIKNKIYSSEEMAERFI